MQIIVNLNKGEKFNGDNFNIWHQNVVFILEEVIKALNNTMNQPPRGNYIQNRHDIEAYKT